MRHVLRGQQPRNEFYFHKRPSDIPEGPEDVADGSAIAVAEKKKTFKKHHGWKMPVKCTSHFFKSCFCIIFFL